MHRVKAGKQRGFWLIDDQGAKQPAYHTHHDFYQKAKPWVAAFKTRNGRQPTRDEFARAALEWLPLEPVPR